MCSYAVPVFVSTITMYPTWLGNLLFYFDIWGLCTQFKRCPNQQKIDSIILVLHVVLASTSSIFILKYITRPVDDTLGTLNDALKFSVLLTSYWLTIFELYFNRKVLQKYWKIFDIVDQHFCSHRQFLLGNYLIKMKIYFAGTTMAYIIYLHRLVTNSGDRFLCFWISYVFVVSAYQHRSFYYLFFLETVLHELEFIDQEVGEMSYDCDNLNSKFLRIRNDFREAFFRQRFKWIRKYYQAIYDMSGTINNNFGWSNVSTILLSFHLVLADVNWFYWKLLNKFEFSILGN